MGMLPRCTQHPGPTQLGLKAVPAQQVYSLDDHGQGLYLRTNQIKQMCGLITYMKHLFADYNSDIDPSDDPFHPFTPDEWSQQTSTMLRIYLVQNLPDPHGPEPVPSRPISSSRPTGYFYRTRKWRIHVHRWCFGTHPKFQQS